MDLINDWFNLLLQINEKLKKERHDTFYFLSVPTPVVELIFQVCLYFSQPEEVRYLSVELFERFTRQHFLDLLDKVWNSTIDSPSEQWKNLEKKLNFQTALRMLSCIQLASKFITHSKIIRPTEIKRFLKAEGKPYLLPMILASEMRVWKTLELQTNFPTVLTFVDLLLELFTQSTNLPLDPIKIRRRIVYFIDIAYLQHQDIYRKLFYASTGRWEPTKKEKQEFRKTECNILYLAAAIVVLCITFTSRDLCDKVCNHLSNLTNLPSQEIKALVEIIIQIIIS